MAALAMASTVSAAKAPFRFLFVTSTSGPLGFVGKTEAAGYRAGINVVNARGGINGATAELKTVDDAGSGAKAVAAVQQETASTSFNVVTCGSFGDDGLPCAAAIAKQKYLQIPAIAESQLNNRKKYPNTFNAGGLFEPAELGMVREMKRKKLKKIVIVVGDNATGRTASGILARAAKKEKVTVTKTVFVPLGATDATPQVQQAQATGAQAMAITGFTPSNIPALKAKAKLGWNVPVYCDWYCANGNFASMTSAERKNIVTQVWPFMINGHKSTKTGAFSTMIAQWKKEQGSDPMFLAITAPLVTYNIPLHVQAAAKVAKSITLAKLKKALEQQVTAAKQVRGFIGPKLLYKGSYHAYRTQPGDFIYTRAGVLKDGFITPDPA
jgi:branched-chain amino acid transport system substrate-binding protein